MGLVRAVIRIWALLGGLVLVALVLMTAASATLDLLFNRPIAGDFELVQMGVAVAAFSFLPYCELTRANVVVDLFTEWASARAKAAMALLGSVVAFGFAGLLIWRMQEGMRDYVEYAEYTSILGIPVWIAFPPILVSLLLLMVAALITAIEGWRRVRGRA
jgi:TRAP-type C4-dicarboxylate transport system permease small subunit